jgi:hypothetical protein
MFCTYVDVGYVLLCVSSVFQVFFFKCFILLLLYVAVVAFRCFKSRSGVAHIAMAIHACFRRMFQMFHLFQTYVASVFI